MPRKPRSRSRSVSTVRRSRRSKRAGRSEAEDIQTALRDLRRATKVVNQFLENERSRDRAQEDRNTGRSRQRRDTRRSRSRNRRLAHLPGSSTDGAVMGTHQRTPRSAGRCDLPDDTTHKGGAGGHREDYKHVDKRRRVRSPRAKLPERANHLLPHPNNDF